MGVVTAASSLIDALVKKNPEEYKGCVSLAVSRLSRVFFSNVKFSHDKSPSIFFLTDRHF